MAMHGSRWDESLEVDNPERDNFPGQDCVRIQDGLVYTTTTANPPTPPPPRRHSVYKPT